MEKIADITDVKVSGADDRPPELWADGGRPIVRIYSAGLDYASIDLWELLLWCCRINDPNSNSTRH